MWLYYECLLALSSDCRDLINFVDSPKEVEFGTDHSGFESRGRRIGHNRQYRGRWFQDRNRNSPSYLRPDQASPIFRPNRPFPFRARRWSHISKFLTLSKRPTYWSELMTAELWEVWKLTQVKGIALLGLVKGAGFLMYGNLRIFMHASSGLRRRK